MGWFVPLNYRPSYHGGGLEQSLANRVIRYSRRQKFYSILTNHKIRILNSNHAAVGILIHKVLVKREEYHRDIPDVLRESEREVDNAMKKKKK